MLIQSLSVYATLGRSVAFVTFVLVTTVFSGILASSEYFKLRPAVYIESVFTDAFSFTKTVNLLIPEN